MLKYKVVRTFLNDTGTTYLQKAFDDGWQYKTAHVLVRESSQKAAVIEYILYKKGEEKK